MRKGNDVWDKPWVTFAAIVGIIAVIIVMLVFFMGGGSPGGGTTAVKVTPQMTSPLIQPVAPATTTSAPGVTIKKPTPVTIPATGVYVKVSYMGSFSGTYGVDNVMEKARDSGERLYAVDTKGGNVSAVFRKEDSSAGHEISVEIYKDGRALKSAKSSAPFGEVAVSYVV
jgi:hypothetical protein